MTIFILARRWRLTWQRLLGRPKFVRSMTKSSKKLKMIADMSSRYILFFLILEHRNHPGRNCPDHEDTQSSQTFTIGFRGLEPTRFSLYSESPVDQEIHRYSNRTWISEAWREWSWDDWIYRLICYCSVMGITPLSFVIHVLENHCWVPGRILSAVVQ